MLTDFLRDQIDPTQRKLAILEDREVSTYDVASLELSLTAILAKFLFEGLLGGKSPRRLPRWKFPKRVEVVASHKKAEAA